MGLASADITINMIVGPFDEFPSDYYEDLTPDWVTWIEDTARKLFYHERWREEGDWSRHFNDIAKRARYGYIEEGMVLIANSWYKIFKDEGYRSFRQYCRHEVKKDYWQCIRLMKAARIGWDLLCLGFEQVPNCVSQAITLADAMKKADDENSQLQNAWQKCVDAANGMKRAMTADFIKSVVTGESEKQSKQIRLPWDIYQALTEKARKRGMTLNEYLAEQAQNEEEDCPDDCEPSEESPEATSTKVDTSIAEKDNDSTAEGTIFPPSSQLGFGSSREIQRTSRDSGLLCRPEPPY